MDAFNEIKKSLAEGTWPGEGEPSNFKSWKSRFVKGGELVGIMKDLDFEIGTDGKLTGKVRFTTNTKYFELNTWKLGIKGPADVTGGVEFMAGNPLLTGGPGDGTYDARGFFQNKEFTEAQISDYITTGIIVDEDGPNIIGGREGREVMGYNPESLQKEARKIMYQRLTTMDWQTYHDLVFYTREGGQMSVILKGGTLGKEVPFGINQPFETLQKMGAVDAEGKWIQEGMSIDAEKACQALQDETQEQFNRGMTKNKGKWTSDCSVAGGTCGVARKVMSTFSDQSNLALAEGGKGTTSVEVARVAANAKAIANFSSNGYNAVVDGENAGISIDEIVQKPSPTSWWAKFNKIYGEDDLPAATKKYNTTFNDALKKFGGGKWSIWNPGYISNRFVTRESLIGSMFRGQKMLNRIEERIICR